MIGAHARIQNFKSLFMTFFCSAVITFLTIDMEIVHKDGQASIRLTDDPPESFCRPAADPMFRSLAKVYGRRLCAVVLTGMGSDGLRGAEAIVAAGGTVVAQDQETSVVWGMPGAVATAGLCSAVMPLPEIAPYIRNLAMRPAA
jgi:two-component system chemotaxis response regulator CheB